MPRIPARALICSLFVGPLLWSCVRPTSLGVYLLPLPAPDDTVEPVLARWVNDNARLRIEDPVTGDVWGEGGSVDGPIDGGLLRFPNVRGQSLAFVLRDGVLEEAKDRPWASQPLSPLERGAATTVRCIWHDLETDRRSTLWHVGGWTYGLDALSADRRADPRPIDALLSITEGGATWPDAPRLGDTWTDPVQTVAPIDGVQSIPCAARSVARWQVRAPPTQLVAQLGLGPHAVDVVETIAPCRAPATVEWLSVRRLWDPDWGGPLRLEIERLDGTRLSWTRVDPTPGAWPPPPETEWRWRDASGSESTMRIDECRQSSGPE